MKWGHSTAMGNNSLCSQFRTAAGMACETRGGKAWPGCMGMGVVHGMETRHSVGNGASEGQGCEQGMGGRVYAGKTRQGYEMMGVGG